MKTNYAKFFLPPIFTISYALFLSLGVEALLTYFGLGLGMGPDSDVPSGIELYPKLMPFCLVLAIVALIAFVVILLLNIKCSEKASYTRTIWRIQSVCAFVISIPMMKAWEMLFEVLEKI